MPESKIDILRRELMEAKIRKTTFTSIELILISYILFWDYVFIVTNNYEEVSCYTLLGDILSQQRMVLALSTVALAMLVAGFTKNKYIRYVSLLLCTALWLVISSSVLLEELNTRSASIILAIFSAYQFIKLMGGGERV